jgi:maltooligosyltrehalose trehalohydrolase
MPDHLSELGANYRKDGQCSFRVWAPLPEKIELRIVAPEEAIIPMQRDSLGYATALISDAPPGTRYFYRLDGQDRPDPASRFQPEGVHGPSEVVAHDFKWTDAKWEGIPLKDYIIYELHAGTFSQKGTFEAIIPRLPELKSLGVTAIELMPIAQFPGDRNWGYDGVGLFAPQNSYGGPKGLKRLVDACHQHGMAVVLDVVYNHLGPEGNYLRDFGFYFSEYYKTPWGEALNFDGAYSDQVRDFFIQNALYWRNYFHIDALRLDAIHAIRDFSAQPFLRELAEAAEDWTMKHGGRFYLIAENDTNNPRFINPPEVGGCGLDAQWSDDFHHALHVLLTGDSRGYYSDFKGVSQFAKVWREGFAYTGEYSFFRKHRQGAPAIYSSPKQFVVCAQNHDQIGNRPHGERLIALTDFERAKVAAAAVLLSPFIPLLFMGEEYGDEAPFLYFISHTDPNLVKAVQEGRSQEFKEFFVNHPLPDPFSPEKSFNASKLNHTLKTREPHKTLYAWHQQLMRLRKQSRAIRDSEAGATSTHSDEAAKFLAVHFRAEAEEMLLAFSFNSSPSSPTLNLPRGSWTKILDSADKQWGGPGASIPDRLESLKPATFSMPAYSVAVFTKG